MLNLSRTMINDWWKVCINMILKGNKVKIRSEGSPRIVIYLCLWELIKSKILGELTKIFPKHQRCCKKTRRNIKSSNSLHHLYLTPTRKHKPKDEGIFSHSKKNLLYYNQSEYKSKICNKDILKSVRKSAQKLRHTAHKIKQRKFKGKSLYSDSYSKKDH